MRPKAAIWPIRSILAAFLVLATFLLAATASAQEYNPARKRPAGAEQPVAERLIVKFRPSSRLSTQATTARESAVVTNAARLNAFASRARLTLEGSRDIGDNLHAVQVLPQSGEGIVETLARVQADSEVEYAVLDRKVYPHATSNDPGALGQWYLAAAQPSAINAQGAWDITKGHDGVVIAVIDTGVRFDHPDLQASGLAGKLLPGYDFVSGDPGGGFRTANDGNGRDPDASDPGDWVATSDGCGVETGGSSWHGTRVSGIIGAMTNNSLGVAGAGWYGYILPVRVLGKCGGFNSDVLAGMRWAAGLNVPGVPLNPNPARVINVSLGSVGGCDAASANTIRDVTDAGVLVVVSAGNEGGPVDSPANCPGAMAILGLRQAGTKVGFSSLGPQIALGAPGGNCVTVGPGEPCQFSIDTTSNAGTTTPAENTYTNQLDFNVGTSFSSPIVSGIAGLMLAVNGNLRSQDLIQRMRSAAKAFPTQSSTTTTQCVMPGGTLQNQECICNTTVCGAGMADALGSVQQALRPIAAIQAPTSVSQGQPFTLDAAGSAASCGRTITGYSWTLVSGSIAPPTPTNTAATSVTPPTSGSATVRVTVTDNIGQTHSADVVISTSTATVQAPARASAGTTACLTAVTPSVIVTATDSGAGEPGNTGTFTVTRGGDPSAALNVSLSITGSAISGTDFQSIATTVAIPAGAQSTTITVTPIDDAALEGMETVIATVQPGTGYTVGTSSAATVNLADDDSPLISVVATDATATEGGDVGVFTVTRTGGSMASAVTVAYALSGNATAGTDYATLAGSVSIPAGQTTATITVTPTDDTTSESSETVVVTLQAGTGYEVTTPSTATITIADNDSAAPSPNDNGGGGGGGALDLLTLLGFATFVASAARRRRAIVESR